MCFPDSTCLQIRATLVRSLELSNRIRLLMVCFCCEEWSWVGSRRASVNVPFGWEDICQVLSPHMDHLCFLVRFLLSDSLKRFQLYFGFAELLKQLVITNTHVWWSTRFCLLFSVSTPTLSLLTFVSLHSTNTKQFFKFSSDIYIVSFKICFSFKLFKNNSVSISCIPLDFHPGRNRQTYCIWHSTDVAYWSLFAMLCSWNTRKVKDTLVSK